MWFFFTLISTISLATRSIISKFGVDKQDPYVVAWATVFFSFPVALLAIIFNKFEITDVGFWPLIALRFTMDTIALLSIMTAFKFKSVSYVAPLLSLTPLFTAFISYFLNGDNLSPTAIFGLLFTAFSCMVIYYSEKSLTKPEDQSDLTKATFFVSVAALLFSLLDPLHPQIISRTNVYTYFFVGTVGFMIIFSIIVLVKSRKKLVESLKNLRLLQLNVVIGILLGIEALTLFIALPLAPAVAVVSSIRTTNTALVAGGGYLFLKEKFNRLKVLGILGSVIGVIIVTIS